MDVPEDVQGKAIDGIVRDDTPNREYAMYGVFSGHVNVTDGHYAYMRAARPELKDEVYNYTLVPHHMNKRFSAAELRDATLAEPFSFTKGCRTLKVKSKDRYNVARFGDRLYDLEADPGEVSPISDPEVEGRFEEALVSLMRECDAPPEQYARLGLTR